MQHVLKPHRTKDATTDCFRAKQDSVSVEHSDTEQNSVPWFNIRTTARPVLGLRIHNTDDTEHTGNKQSRRDEKGQSSSYRGGLEASKPSLRVTKLCARPGHGNGP